MQPKSITSVEIADQKTRELCNELVHFLSLDGNTNLEAGLEIHKKLSAHLQASMTENQAFYAAHELEFLIGLVNQLSNEIDSSKQQVANEMINRQRNSKAVKKYKSNS